MASQRLYGEWGDFRQERQRTILVRTSLSSVIESWVSADEIAAHLGVTKDSIEVTIEQRVLRIAGRADLSLPEGLAPLHLEYQPGDYERVFTLSEAVDPNGIEARIRDGVLRVRLPKAAPAQRRRIEIKAD